MYRLTKCFTVFIAICCFFATISDSVVDGFHKVSHTLSDSEHSHHHFSDDTKLGRRLHTANHTHGHDHGFLSFVKKLIDGDHQDDDSQLIIKMSKNFKVLVTQDYPTLYFPLLYTKHRFRYFDIWKDPDASINAPPPRGIS